MRSLDFLGGGGQDSARSADSGGTSQRTARSSVASTARSTASAESSGQNIFGDEARRRRRRAETPNEEGLEQTAEQMEQMHADDESRKRFAINKEKQIRVFTGMLSRSGFTTREIQRHMHYLTHLNYSEKVSQGRVSNELFHQIDSERQFDRYNRPVKSKKLAQQQLVANIQNALASKKNVREEQGKMSGEKGKDDLQSEKWKIGFKPPVFAPPGLAQSVLVQLNSEGNEVFFNYDGTWKDGKLHGTGVLKYVDRFTYTGEFRAGWPHGEGTAVYPNGHRYEGYWREGRYHGHGTLQCGPGTTYKGQWKNGKRHGTGVLYLRSGYTYAGQWLFNKQHGRGEAKSSKTGVEFTGHFARGLVRRGIGRLKMVDPSSGKGKVIQQDFSFSRGASLKDLRNYMVEKWKQDRRDQEEDKSHIFGVEVAILIQEYVEAARKDIVEERNEEKAQRLEEKKRADILRRKKIREKSLEAMRAMMGGEEA